MKKVSQIEIRYKLQLIHSVDCTSCKYVSGFWIHAYVVCSSQSNLLFPSEFLTVTYDCFYTVVEKVRPQKIYWQSSAGTGSNFFQVWISHNTYIHTHRTNTLENWERLSKVVCIVEEKSLTPCAAAVSQSIFLLCLPIKNRFSFAAAAAV